MNPVDALMRYPLFALLGERALAAWVKAGERLTVPTGTMLLQSDTLGTFAYLVREGRVRVVRSGDSRDVALGFFGPGEVFGEYALLPPHRNTATCRASETTALLRLPLSLLQRPLTMHPGLAVSLKNWLRLHALLGYLRQGTFLGFLSAPSVMPLLDRCREVAVPADWTIQAPGLAADRWFFIRQGQVALEPAEGSRGTVRLLGPGDCFGESALMGAAQLPVAGARTDTVCLGISQEEFFRPLSGEEPSLFQTTASHLPKQHRPYEWVEQRGPADCGVAALCMALRALGAEVSSQQIAERTPLLHKGANLLDLAQTARHLGFRAIAVRVTWERLREVQLPALAHLEEGHYVTILECQPEALTIGDPSTGVKKLPFDAFRRQFSGHLLLVSPERKDLRH